MNGDKLEAQPLPAQDGRSEEPSQRPLQEDRETPTPPPTDWQRGGWRPHMCLAVVEMGLMADGAWCSDSDPFHYRARRLWLDYHQEEPPRGYLSEVDALSAPDVDATREMSSLADQQKLWQSIVRARDLWEAPTESPLCQALQLFREQQLASGSDSNERQLREWDALVAATFGGICGAQSCQTSGCTLYADHRKVDLLSQNDWQDDNVSLVKSDYKISTENDSVPATDDSSIQLGETSEDCPSLSFVRAYESWMRLAVFYAAAAIEKPAVRNVKSLSETTLRSCAATSIPSYDSSQDVNSWGKCSEVRNSYGGSRRKSPQYPVSSPSQLNCTAPGYIPAVQPSLLVLPTQPPPDYLCPASQVLASNLVRSPQGHYYVSSKPTLNKPKSPRPPDILDTMHQVHARHVSAAPSTKGPRAADPGAPGDQRNTAKENSARDLHKQRHKKFRRNMTTGQRPRGGRYFHFKRSELCPKKALPSPKPWTSFDSQAWMTKTRSQFPRGAKNNWGRDAPPFFTRNKFPNKHLFLFNRHPVRCPRILAR